MDDFEVHIGDRATFITNEAHGFIMKVEKDRQLTSKDSGAIIEATLYKEVSTFIAECNYVFEVVNEDHQPVTCEVNVDFFTAAVRFFFNSILDTAYFLRKIPAFSSLNKSQAAVNDFSKLENYSSGSYINTANLYNLLSGS